ncbi:MAG TPA: glycosyltransferase family 2 protein [Gammaproteobacteria bacterium]|jgi:glycosyltransferase involved in cell wall biosynthesis|nr:glycosyltransferase family 2 protein [Gammaproteobacteria bacterium]
MLSIVMPCYNEEKNLPFIFNKLKNIVTDRDDIEIVLVDNGSKDNSAAVFQDLIQKTNSPFFKVITVSHNQGYGHGILSGLAAATGDVLAWTHADMQTDPNDVLKAYDLYKTQQTQPCLVKGKRYKRAFLDAAFSFGMQLIANRVLKTALDDINAQPKLFSRQFYETQIKKNAPLDFSLDLFLLYQAHKNQLNIIHLPVFFNKRVYGEAKGGGSLKNKYKLTKRTLNYIFSLKKHIASR